MTARPRVVVADDHALFREGLAAVLSDRGVDVVGQAGTRDEAYDVVTSTHPDVVLMDVEMPGDPIRAALQRLARDQPSVAVIVLSMHNPEELRSELAPFGLSGIMSKSAPADAVAAAVRCVVGVPQQSGSGSAGSHALSPRQLEVLQLVAAGLSNQEVARRLFIAPGTVKRHLDETYARLGVHSRTQASFAIRSQLRLTP
jgi:DNA-binding NarL/FixJ family response regulator